ncbi:hypothetical protein AOLI_G00198330 [Acnodon oligacanthus]
MKNSQRYFKIEKPDFESSEKGTSLENQWELTRWACTGCPGSPDEASDRRCFAGNNQLRCLALPGDEAGKPSGENSVIQAGRRARPNDLRFSLGCWRVELEARRPLVANLPADWDGLGGRLVRSKTHQVGDQSIRCSAHSPSPASRSHLLAGSKMAEGAGGSSAASQVQLLFSCLVGGGGQGKLVVIPPDFDGYSGQQLKASVVEPSNYLLIMDLRSKMRKDGQKNTQMPDGDEAKDGAREQPLIDEDLDAENSPDLLTVLPTEIKEGNKTLSQKIDSNTAELQNSIAGLCSTLNGLIAMVTDAEQRISEAQDTVSRHEQLVTQLLKDNESLKSKVDYLENYSRRNNVRIMGLKEGTEGRDPVKVFGEWLPQVLGAAYFSSLLDIERAHRTPSSKPALNEPPRPVLIRCLRYQDREKILQLAKEQGNITVQKKKANLFPDMSPELVRRRKQMIPALKALKERNFTCYITYPTQLRVQLKDCKFRLFNAPGDVSKFIEEDQT